MFAPQGFPTEMDDAADGVVAVKTIQSPKAILVKTNEEQERRHVERPATIMRGEDQSRPR